MKINYPMNRTEAEYFLKMEIGEIDDDILDKIFNFFEVNVVAYKEKTADLADYISRKELENKISEIAYDAAQSIEWDLQQSIKESIIDAFR